MHLRDLTAALRLRDGPGSDVEEPIRVTPAGVGAVLTLLV